MLKQPLVSVQLAFKELKRSAQSDEELSEDISISNVSKKYGEFFALRSVNLKFGKGRVHCLLGHNGAGKTTLIDILTGIQQPTEGSVVIMGREVQSQQAFSSGVRLSVGVCLPNDILQDELTVYSHLLIAALIKGIANTANHVDKILTRLRLLQYKKSKVKTLSGGCKRRLSLAIALIGDPDLLFLDEPTSSIDPGSRREIWQILEELKRGNSRLITILATHHLEEAEYLADSLVVLSQGRVKFSGPIEDMKRQFGVGLSIRLLTNAETDGQQALAFIELARQIDSAQPTAKRLQQLDGYLEVNFGTEEKALLEQFCKSVAARAKDAALTVNSNTLESAYLCLDQEVNSEN